MLDRDVLQTFGNYLVQHPEELIRGLRNATLLRLGVPLAALRWVAERSGGPGRPTDVSLEAVPPGLRIGMTVAAMGTPLRVSGLVLVDAIQLGSDALRIELRVREVTLRLLGASDSPLAALIQSGALDLGKIGNLVAVMPRRPAFLVEAKGERIVLDLKQLPALGGPMVEQLVRLITPLLTVKGAGTDLEHLDIQFDVLSRGMDGALQPWKEFALSALTRFGGMRFGRTRAREARRGP
ncbi:MAG TPA: hypothetical protein VG963_28285 [Polyangiaceae bacterium]|nr:hypothetical protein [Polyangiaceae bacterium]